MYPSAKSASIGQCNFVFYELTVWNSLPFALHDSSLSLKMFRQAAAETLDSDAYHPLPRVPVILELF